MRTTIDIPDDLRARLLDLAARKGLKGYSTIVAEALRRYLNEEADQSNRTQRLLALKGAWSTDEATEVENRIKEVRARWTSSSTPRP